MDLDSKSWDSRYQEANTPWDVGYITPPIKKYIDVLENKDTRILIPGAGNAWEAIYLFEQGFRNIFVCDWAKSALCNIKDRMPEITDNQLICQNYFKLDIKVDLILEQTFFCAISPEFRYAYAEQSANLLNENGKLAGLLFAEHFEKAGPPFGGTASEYKTYFDPFFIIQKMELCLDSIEPRMGRELCFEMVKK